MHMCTHVHLSKTVPLLGARTQSALHDCQQVHRSSFPGAPLPPSRSWLHLDREAPPVRLCLHIPAPLPPGLQDVPTVPVGTDLPFLTRG